MTGNLNIDGLLSAQKWNASLISYSTPDVTGDYQSGYGLDVDPVTAGLQPLDVDNDGLAVLSDGFSQFNAAQTVALQAALDSQRFVGSTPGGAAFAAEGFTNLLVTWAGAGSGVGSIRAANAADSSTAYASIPDGSIYSGDIFVNSATSSNATPRAGNYGWATIYHEAGHALGLKHGHVGDPPFNSAVLPSAVDSMEYSVMTYRSYIGGPTNSGTSYETWGAPQTYMMLDILALQTMYGANYSINSGNTTYTWDPFSGKTYIDGQVAIDPGDNRIFATIWDGGGTDTYDLSNYATNLDINLNPGEFSTFADAQLSYLGGGVFARGNIANAMLFGGNTASLIEIVKGGSGSDDIVGNSANNTLYGNDGFDIIYGMDGSDALYGGSGNDVLDGGLSYDVMSGGTGNDTVYVDNISDVVLEALGEGTDILHTTVNFALSNTAYFETMIADGSASINLTGNASAQRIEGNSGDNRIAGGDGNDTLRGNAGSDTFVFATTPSGTTNRDVIEDFSVSLDRIELSRSVFTALNAGSSLNAGAFWSAAGAHDADDRIVYNSSTGALYYDSDGNGAASQIQFASLSTGLAISSSSFILVA